MLASGTPTGGKTGARASGKDHPAEQLVKLADHARLVMPQDHKRTTQRKAGFPTHTCLQRRVGSLDQTDPPVASQSLIFRKQKSMTRRGRQQLTLAALLSCQVAARQASNCF